MPDLLDIPIQPATVTPNLASTVPAPTEAQPSTPTTTIEISPLPSPAPQPTTVEPYPTEPEKVCLVLPAIDEMEQALIQTGVLLQDLPLGNPNLLDKSPLSALQPKNLLHTAQGDQPMSLPSQHEGGLKQNELATTHKDTPVAYDWYLTLHPYIKKALAFGLIVQGFIGLFKSIEFLIVEYPKLELQLVSHQITASEINGYATRAVIMGFFTFFNVFVALKIWKSGAAKKMQTVMGIILFLFSSYLNSYLSTRYNLITIISEPLIEFLRQLEHTGL